MAIRDCSCTRVSAAWFLSIVFPLLLMPEAHAQQYPRVVINEFLASNVATNAEIVDYDDFSDWIELYNADSNDVDISGYALTDNPGNPAKWKFPVATVIPAKGFLLLWADGFNDVPGTVRQRPYSPYENFTTQYYHLNFKLDAAGEFIGLAAPDGRLIDSVEFGMQRNDISRGRKPDGSPGWFSFGEPTPGSANSTEGVTGVEYSGAVRFSPPGGFFTGSQAVSLQTETSGAEIRYTMDGSTPTSSSQLYAGPIAVTHTTIIRARTFVPGKFPGAVGCSSYFVNESTVLPVLSVTTSPDLLWDPSSGIYSRIFREREIPIHFEFFEPGGTSGFAADAGFMLTGQQSIMYPQKSFTMTSAARFGTDAFVYQVFPQRKLNTFTSLYVRNGGLPDNRSTLFRDALLHALVLNSVDLDCQADRTVAAFLDGQYWGIYMIRDKINAAYLGSIHGVNPMDIDLLEYVTTPNPEVMEGNAANFQSFLSFVASTDLSIDANYRMIASWMDIDEYINWQIAEIYADNVVCWDQNVRVWRERKDGARWRWILFDTDYGFGMPCPMSTGYTHNTLRYATSSNIGEQFILPEWSTLLLRKLLSNAEFKIKFIQRFASSLNSMFGASRVESLINQFQQTLSPEMTRHIARWNTGDDALGSPIPDYATWLNNVAVVRAFARNRPTYQRQHIVDYFGLDGTFVLLMSISPPTGGHLLINGMEKITGSADGRYFKGVPTRLQAIPEVGYRFVRWEGIDSATANPVEIMPSRDSVTVTAVFESVAFSNMPEHISTDTALTAAHSPYYALQSVTVDSGGTLRLGEGVRILMPEGASIVVHGGLIVDGSELHPVSIEPNETARSWGALCFVNASDSSSISHLRLTGATKGPDFTRDWAAISGYRSRFSLQNVSVENCRMPLFAQFGSLSVRNCRFRSTISADLVNIKRADYALLENNDLLGNGEFDSDGIDYDGVASGAIRGNVIRNLYGFNSDAIDLGEDARNILVEGNRIYNICDKGVSVGQASTTLIRRNVIANCGMGVGIKDFNSFARIEQNTFYGNQIGVACYEKILGHGGAYCEIVNCVIANSVQSSVFVDKLSALSVSYSLSNTDTLPGLHNLQAEPSFLNEFRPATGSPVIDQGSPVLPSDPDGSLPDLGAMAYDPQNQINILIDEIHYHPKDEAGRQFIEILNAGIASVNLQGYRCTGSIEHTFGDVSIASGERLVLAKNAATYSGHGYPVVQWDSGELSPTGSLVLTTGLGDTLDEVDYGNAYFWPSQPDGLGPSLELHRTTLENMISSSWRSSYVEGGTPGRSAGSIALTGILINEFLAENDSVLSDESGEFDDWIEIYNSTTVPVDLGGLAFTDNLGSPGKCQITRNDPQSTTVPPKGFLLFWADGQPEQGPRHLSFKLDRAGEQIGLAQDLDAGYAFIDSLSFGPQQSDVSYGRYPDGSTSWRTLNPPTPSASNQGTSDVPRRDAAPAKFSLFQNYPNPFNPKTVISGQWTVDSRVRLVVYDLLGREVAVLANGRYPAGKYSFNFNGSGYASGVYFYRLTAGAHAAVRSMCLVK